MTIPTPPPTSLSPAASPTTSDPNLPLTSTSMPSPRPLYLIVATSLSPALGIGLKGTLPWPPLKSDMSFFARVTKRSTPGKKNIVVMGRKTYESIPQKFRPLQGRRNLVITRAETRQLQNRLRAELEEEDKKRDVCCVGSLREAVELMQESVDQEGATVEEGKATKTFIIGGAEIYKSALRENHMGVFTHLRILQTEVQRKDDASLEIDTFFPIDVRNDSAWRQAENGEVAGWIGEDVPQVKSGDQEWKEDGDFKIRTLGWEKELSPS